MSRPGHPLGENISKIARNEKRKKLCGFSYDKNIANFEAFCQDKKNLAKTCLLFLRSVEPSVGSY